MVFSLNLRKEKVQKSKIMCVKFNTSSGIDQVMACPFKGGYV